MNTNLEQWYKHEFDIITKIFQYAKKYEKAGVSRRVLDPVIRYYLCNSFMLNKTDFSKKVHEGIIKENYKESPEIVDQLISNLEELLKKHKKE